jgi:hypothetical protein
MDAPTLPFTNRAKSIGYSLLLILWWVAVWGIANTVINLLFKGDTLKELGVYILIVTFVLLIIFVHPEFVQRL